MTGLDRKARCLSLNWSWKLQEGQEAAAGTPLRPERYASSYQCAHACEFCALAALKLAVAETFSLLPSQNQLSQRHAAAGNERINLCRPPSVLASMTPVKMQQFITV